MQRILKLFRYKSVGRLRVPKYIRHEFLEETVRKNNFSLWIICIIIFSVELFNMARVVFWSRSGLGTRNNRIYFTMYCLLILFGILWLVLRHSLRKASVRGQWIAQYVVSWSFLLWHMALNTYDLYRDPAAGTTVLTTALMGLALLIQAPPLYSIAQCLVSYVLFRVVTAPLLGAGDRLNMTITFMVALAVSLAHAHHTGVSLKQKKKIVEINAKLQELVRRDPMTGLLNKTTIECWAEQMLHGLEHRGRTNGLTLFLIDLDEFKQFNDRYGHPCGDHVLVETAEAMRRAFPDAAGLGRIGGDEFAILYDKTMTKAQAMTLTQDFMERLRNIQWEDQPLGIQCSMGACICAKPQCTYQQLYTDTDQMLYQAKENGKGQCCVRQL